jgi:hypothetical protein
MSKASKQAKYERSLAQKARNRAHKRRKPLVRGFTPNPALRPSDDCLTEMVIEQGLLAMLRSCGITRIIKRAILAPDAPPPQEEFGPEGAD